MKVLDVYMSICARAYVCARVGACGCYVCAYTTCTVCMVVCVRVHVRTVTRFLVHHGSVWRRDGTSQWADSITRVTNVILHVERLRDLQSFPFAHFCIPMYVPKHLQLYYIMGIALHLMIYSVV